MRDNTSPITEANDGKNNFTWPMFLLLLNNFSQNTHYHRENVIYVFYNNVKIFFAQVLSFTTYLSIEIKKIKVGYVCWLGRGAGEVCNGDIRYSSLLVISN
jgi:hypothetical protein